MLLNQNRKECIESEISSGRTRGRCTCMHCVTSCLTIRTVGRERSQHLYRAPSFLPCLEKFSLPWRWVCLCNQKELRPKWYLHPLETSPRRLGWAGVLLRDAEINFGTTAVNPLRVSEGCVPGSFKMEISAFRIHWSTSISYECKRTISKN